MALITYHSPDRLVARGALVALVPRIKNYLHNARLLLVADDATMHAAGERAASLLTSNYPLATYSLGTNITASLACVEAVMDRAQVAQANCIIAVGSGTINDICKLAAFRSQRPYLAIATAASMNGYTSANASIVAGQHKTSLPAAPPKAVIADLDIIAAAPERMARAGLGDTLCRATVEADALLSHHLLYTEFPAEGFATLRSHEAALMAGADKLRSQDPHYMSLLMAALLDGGDWMTRTGSSAIASQGEHMIAHTLEMLHPQKMHAYLHGEVIAVASSSMQGVQRQYTSETNAHRIPIVRGMAGEQEIFVTHFGKVLGTELCAQFKKKNLNIAQVTEINQRLAKEWPHIHATLAEVTAPFAQIQEAFAKAGLATTSEALGLDEAEYTQAIKLAHLTRDRFTFLDLAAMA